MIAALLALVLLRIEKEGEGERARSVFLTEIFIEDMDVSLRQIGIGDYVVGKHVGRLMGQLGGRLGALRGAFSGEADLAAAIERNLYRGAPPPADEAALAAARLRAFNDKLADMPLADLYAARLPRS